MERLHGQPDSVRASRTAAAGEFRAHQVTSKQAEEGPDGDLIQVCSLGHRVVRTPCCPWCCQCTMLNMHRDLCVPWWHCTVLAALCVPAECCMYTEVYVPSAACSPCNTPSHCACAVLAVPCLLPCLAASA